VADLNYAAENELGGGFAEQVTLTDSPYTLIDQKESEKKY